MQGLPATYEPGRSYVLTLTLVDEIMTRAGFEAALRFAEGARAGTAAGRVAPADERVALTEQAGVPYLHHAPGGQGVAGGRASWSFTWTAPDSGGAVSLHAAANAANDDSSPFGDLVHLLTAQSRTR